MPTGVPLFAGGGGGVVEPPLQPFVIAIVIAKSNIGAAKVSLTIGATYPKRASPLVRSRIQSSTGSIARTQRIGRRLGGLRREIEGNEGINRAFAVVLTLIATVAGALDVTVIGAAGPLHIALGGAPVQFTVTLS